MTVMFRENALTPDQKLAITNAKAKEMVERLVKDVALDKRFVYYLLAATGICVVPLTGFNCDLRGFRVTLLESDDAKFEWIFRTLREKITEYLQSI
jgi:aspartate/methionine/tyrosine aminotransferase